MFYYLRKKCVNSMCWTAWSIVIEIYLLHFICQMLRQVWQHAIFCINSSLVILLWMSAAQTQNTQWNPWIFSTPISAQMSSDLQLLWMTLSLKPSRAPLTSPSWESYGHQLRTPIVFWVWCRSWCVNYYMYMGVISTGIEYDFWIYFERKLQI